MPETMLHELVQIVSDSKIPSLKYTVEVTPRGFTSKLEDKDGQRGTSFGGSLSNGESSHGTDLNSLEGHARGLLLQEARNALRANPEYAMANAREPKRPGRKPGARKPSAPRRGR